MYISANHLNVYDSSYKLIDDNTTISEWEKIIESLPKDASGNYSEALSAFEHLEDDFETYNYLVLDYEHVVMVFDGDIVREWETVSDFIKETLEQVEIAVKHSNYREEE